MEGSLEAVHLISEMPGVMEVGPNFERYNAVIKRRSTRDEVEEDLDDFTYREYRSNSLPDLTQPPAFHGRWFRTIQGHEISQEIVDSTGRLVYANVDTGVDFEHPALASNYLGKGGDHNYAWFDGSTNNTLLAKHFPLRQTCPKHTLFPCDYKSHGTSTLSLAVGSNKLGISPKSKWMTCRHSGVYYANTESYIRCFQFILAPTDLEGKHPWVDKRTHVVGNSWGCPVAYNCFIPPFEYAYQAHSLAGIFDVASSGNSGKRGCAPIDSPSARSQFTFVVAATNYNGTQRMSFSSFGPSPIREKSIDISAPGVSNLGAMANRVYSYSSGTSNAVPIVGGAALSITAACPYLERDVVVLAEVIRRSAVPIYPKMACGGDTENSIPNNESGYGLLNVKAEIELCSSREFKASLTLIARA